MLTIQDIRINAAKNSFKAFNSNESQIFSTCYSPKNQLQLEQLSFLGKATINKGIDQLFERYAKPVISRERLEKWVNQFDEKDRKTALKLAQSITFNSYTDMVSKSISLHKKLTAELKVNGFDTEFFQNVDFTSAFKCKSGDIVSYIYRRSNKIRNVVFKPIEILRQQNPQQVQDRALVVFDDYAGTGLQLLSDFYAQVLQNRAIISSYKKVYFVTIAANETTIKRFDLLKQGKLDELSEAILKDYKIVPENLPNGGLRKALSLVQGGKLQLITEDVELPLLAPHNTKLSEKDKKEIEAFLLKYNCGRPFGWGAIQGNTTFFYGPPNNLPDILWNARMNKKGYFPLFERINDISIYPASSHIDIKEQVW